VAKRRVGLSRRSLIAGVLLGFVLLTTGVIARRVHGVDQVRQIRRLKETRTALEAERVRLDGAIRAASSRARMVPIAEQRLNMHIALPEEQIYLPRPERRAPVARDSLRP